VIFKFQDIYKEIQNIIHAIVQAAKIYFLDRIPNDKNALIVIYVVSGIA